MQKNSSKLKKLDYTLWSSPVDEQNILAFSPHTNVNRFYNYSTSTNLYTVIGSPATTSFTTATGYLIRMPNNHPSVATTWNGTFTGVPNNGDITYTIQNLELGRHFYLIGNPYPSKINADEFIQQNSNAVTGAIYFWRKTNNAKKPSYCTWTKAGFTSNGEDQVFSLGHMIASGQGFFVEVLPDTEEIIFRNSQRSDDVNQQFFKSQNVVETNRIWLNATNSSGAYSQMLLGYLSGATVGVDYGIDGKYNNDGAIALTSTIDGKAYAIQGRPVPFEASDVVPLQFKAKEAGSYTIAIDRVDGLFENDQTIYLKDQLTGSFQDLKLEPYTFISEAGTFEDRFSIVYQNPLSTNQFAQEKNSVIVFQKNNYVIVRSAKTPLKSVKVLDALGRLLYDYNNINSTEITIPARNMQQLVLLQITDENNQIIVKKLID